MRIISGIKPSGRPHLGNYLGAIREHIALQNQGHECFYFVADLHALTTLRDADAMRDYRKGVVLDYLALGLDPEKSTFFFQSDVPAHSELLWLLASLTPHGLLERAHAWKDAQNNSDRDMNAGLFIYPVLMAADILIYNVDGVPVGKDQKQHIEIARDIAQKFNNTFGEVFTLPEAMIKEEVATIRGTDGRKMSKSYGNTISLFADEATLKKQVMGIQTQSLPLEEPMPLQDDLILELYSTFATPEELESLKNQYQAGGFGYGRAKQALLDLLLKTFAEARERRQKLEAEDLEQILQMGAQKAQAAAQKTLDAVHKKMGLL